MLKVSLIKLFVVALIAMLLLATFAKACGNDDDDDDRKRKAKFIKAASLQHESAIEAHEDKRVQKLEAEIPPLKKLIDSAIETEVPKPSRRHGGRRRYH